MYRIERDKAIELRRRGLSYREILVEIPVAKSTLSKWLKEVKLAVAHQRTLSERQRQGALRGAQARRLKKEKDILRIKFAAKNEIGPLSKRELQLIGAALYWAEGSKEKVYKPGVGLIFSNSDPAMIKLYLSWLEAICAIPRHRIGLSLYLHELKIPQAESIKKFWIDYLKYPQESMKAVYFKRNKINTHRKNIGVLYYGVMRVKVSMSSALNRKVSGWIEGICASE